MYIIILAYGVVLLKVQELISKHSYRKIKVGDGTRKIILQFIYACVGFVMSNGAMFGEYAPFGISIISAAPFKNIFFTFIGSVIGYIVFPTGSSSFRYIAAMIAVIAIRWTLNDIKRLSSHPFFSFTVCFITTLVTGIAIMSVTGFTSRMTVIYIIEAFLGGVSAYFFSRTITTLNGTKSLGMLMPQELACLVMSGCVGILSLANVSVGSLSVGRIIAVTVILFTARYGGIAGGTIAGVSTGIVFGLSSSEFSFLGASYAFGGLMAGLFSPLGKAAAAISFILSNAVISMQTGDLTLVIQGLYEVAAASLIFIALPKNAGNFIANVFMSDKGDEHCEGLRRSIIMRLDFASKAISDVSSDIDEVSEKLSKIVTPTVENVYKNAVDNTCRRCGMRVFCWEHRDGVTLESFEFVTDTLKKNGSIRAEDFRDDFKRKCCRTSEMALSVNRYYKNYLASEAASKRVDEIRSVVASQFCGLGDILAEMADEYENYEFFDRENSERICTSLKELGLVPIDVCCHVDYMGRMNVEIEIEDTDRKKIQRAVIVKDISKICGRHFDSPSVTAAHGRCRIVLCERPFLDVEIATSQHISDNGQLCGDHFRYFNDGMGRMISVLSDGMGTGGRAAIDGSMAASIMAKLIKSGLGFDCSLKVVNSALLVKSSDESLATLDVTAIDLYSGDIDFMKAGAAISFIRKAGDMYRVETPSLPLGILPEVEFTYTEDTLSVGDIIVMVSDGAVATGEEWIEHIISTWEDKSMQQLADLINDEATARRNDGHDDDITVMAMQIKKH